MKQCQELLAEAAAGMVREANLQEIERAIDKAKRGLRSPIDQWYRRQWYRAQARRRWQEKQKSPWHRQQVSGACGHGGKQNEPR